MANTQAKKLQALLQLAHANGWIYNPYGKPFLEESYLQLVNLFCRDNKVLNYETVIFDHEFINALCNSRINTYIPIGYADLPTQFTTVIRNLALSKNRIDYLYGEFCE